MGPRNRSRRAQLQGLLGELGTVRPYVARANGSVPTAGWYIDLEGDPEGLLTSEVWRARDGAIFAGLDTTHAAACIERVRGLLEV